jgi:hypothetical protein
VVLPNRFIQTQIYSTYFLLKALVVYPQMKIKSARYLTHASQIGQFSSRIWPLLVVRRPRAVAGIRLLDVAAMCDFRIEQARACSDKNALLDYIGTNWSHGWRCDGYLTLKPSGKGWYLI